MGVSWRVEGGGCCQDLMADFGFCFLARLMLGLLVCCFYTIRDEGALWIREILSGGWEWGEG